MSPMLTVEQAREKICASITPLAPEPHVQRPLREAVGQVLATAITAPINVPPADNSAMDGYALNTNDLGELPFSLPVSQRIAAGMPPEPLRRGTAARIFTGAEIPPGANAVVTQESCTEDNGTVTLLEQVQEGDNIRPMGQDIAAGAQVLTSGQRLRPQDLGLIASLGLDHAAVRRPVRVALVNTGNELVMPGVPLQPGQIYNSNFYTLAALFSQWGCDIVSFTQVDDSLTAVIDVFNQAASEADLVVSSGGISVGEEDHVKAAVEALGELDLWKIAMKPGKPVAFGRLGETPFLGLPGNPVSAFTTALLFAKPLLQTLRDEPVQPLFTVQAPARFIIDKPRQRREYLRARITSDGVSIHPNQSSGVLTSVSWADAFAVLPEDTLVAPGDKVDVLLLSPLIYD